MKKNKVKYFLYLDVNFYKKSINTYLYMKNPKIN